MKRIILVCLLFSGCTGIGPVGVYGSDGAKREFVWFNMNPLCLFFCSTQMSTSGVRTDAVGGGDITTGASTNTQSQTSSSGGTQ